MPLLDLICLANARKHSERCVACLRIDGNGWVRLVSAASHGELTYPQRNLAANGEPQNFDLIRVEVLRPKPAIGQPENWLIANAPWKLLERPAPRSLQDVVAKALHLESSLFGSYSDRVAARFFQLTPSLGSLALLKPEEVQFRHEILGSKKRVRALFILGQHEFNLSVTDPPFEQRIKCLEAGDYAPGEFGIRDENRLLFCASLGEPFQDGNCYKLIAGVLELPALWPAVG